MELRIESVAGLDEIPPADWDALAGEDDPFVEHAFLAALERSGSVGAEAGWLPCHVTARAAGRLVGAAPLYLKVHSYGEYIFDWGWARAAHEAGIAYYPKVVGAVPFTPVTGRRLLVAPDADEGAVLDGLVAGARAVADAAGASSLHFLFLTGSEQSALARRGLLARLSSQYHWENTEGWASFEDYLGSMRASSRKQVRRERRVAASHGLELSIREGRELGDAEWSVLWEVYQSTAARKWGSPYLTRDFFERLRTELAHRVVAAFAHRGERPVAAALCFQKGGGLYGRYWGSLERLDCLHFELCYYLPLQYCLERGIRRFEAGAQGEHKVRRGLMPRETYSSHWLRHPELARAVASFTREEARAVREEMDWLARHGPFRRDEPAASASR